MEKKSDRTTTTVAGQASFLSIYPQTSSTISFTRANFFHCSSSVSLFPISQEANPHCGLKHRRSNGITFSYDLVSTLLTRSVNVPFLHTFHFSPSVLRDSHILQLRHLPVQESGLHFLRFSFCVR